MPLSETELLDAIRRLLSTSDPQVVVGLGDDAAVVRPASGQLVLTTDALVEGTHFTSASIRPRDLGYKAVMTSVSDVAAMAAAPRFALCALTLSGTADPAWVVELAGGMLEACDEHALRLVGGNLTRGRELSIVVTVVGEVAPGRALTRGGARPGDRLVVTGSLGGSAAGLRFEEERTMTTPGQRAAVRRHQRPTARVGEAAVLAAEGATAMIDVSDGFALDAARLAEESRVGLRISLPSLPVAAEATAREALAGGEDYELLATLPGAGAVEAARRVLDERFGTALTQVGVVTEEGLVTIDEDGTEGPLEPEGWDPFR